MMLIGNIHDTDKVTYHGYHRFYPRYIKEFQSYDNMGMIEIGMDKLKSLNMWLEYFPKAFIYGVDIGIKDKGERHLIFQADQSDLAALMELSKVIKNKGHNIYFINDDGSHVPSHIYITFDFLFYDILEEGGVYIIEDIETSYWKNGNLYGYNVKFGYLHKESVIEIFKQLVDDLNKEYLTQEDREVQRSKVGIISEKTKSLISTITFGQNCIIITKKTKEELEYDNRPYKWPKFLKD